MWMFRKRKDEGAGRRNHERCKAKLPFRFRQGNHIIMGSTEELSLTSAYASTSDTQGPKGLLETANQITGEFSLILPTKEIRIPSVIARSDEFGMAFLLMSKAVEDADAELKEYLETQLGQIW